MAKSEYYPVIVDVGSRFIRVGLAGASSPITCEVKLETKSSPQLRSPQSSTGPLVLPPWFELSDIEIETRESQIKLRQQMESNYPVWPLVSRQYQTDLRKWNVLDVDTQNKQAMVLCLRHALSKLALPLKWMKVIMVASCGQSNARTLWLAEIMLHSVLVKSIVLYPEPLLQCILANTNNGLIIDLRWLETSIVGAVDLREVSSEVLERRFSGAALHYVFLEELLLLKIPQLDDILISDKSFPFIEEFVINSCYVRSREEIESADTEMYLITDTVSVPNRLRYEIIEKVYFDGTLQKAVENLVKNCPIDIRKLLQNNIIITGGVSQIPGFKKRLIQELSLVCPKLDTRVCLGSWTGVSLYLSMLLTRNSWDVLKPREINREELGTLVLAKGYKFSKLDEYLIN